MEFRQARAEELPYLAERLAEAEGETINLNTARIWVAVEGRDILGMMPLRMVWQAEPLLIFPEVSNRMTRRRAGWGIFEAAQAWLADRSENKSGIYWFFAVTRSNSVKGWLTRLGMLKQYAGAQTFIKHL